MIVNYLVIMFNLKIKTHFYNNILMNYIMNQFIARYKIILSKKKTNLPNLKLGHKKLK